MQYDRTVIGYHGCSVDTAEALLSGADYRQSENAWDWLGRGVYFWEFGLERAWDWAREHNGPSGAAVVGAVIQLGDCLDLLDTGYTKMLSLMAPVWVHQLKEAGEPVPENKGTDHDLKRRYFDCALVNWSVDFLDHMPEEHRTRFQCVRGSFQEGAPVFSNSAIRRQSHIQVAVRDPTCIIGTFRPNERVRV